MPNLVTILRYSIVAAEGLALLAGLWHIRKWRHTYWLSLILYLAFIFGSELLGHFGPKDYSRQIGEYFKWMVIPVEYLFLILLLGIRVLELPKLSLIAAAIFIGFYAIGFIWFNEPSATRLPTIAMTAGNVILLGLTIAILLRVAKTDAILTYYRLMPVYVSMGVLLFFLSNFLFTAWTNLMLSAPRDFMLFYYYIFAVSNIFMYLLFAAGFIWAKKN